MAQPLAAEVVGRSIVSCKSVLAARYHPCHRIPASCRNDGAGSTLPLRPPHQRQHIVIAQPSAVSGAFQQIVGEVAFGGVECQDAFFDGALGDQPVDGDRALLADAVGAVAGLVFHRGVPPGVHVDHIVGGGEVQAEAAGAQADQEEFALARLKGGDGGAALGLGGAAVQILVADAAGVQVGAQDAQVIDELAEHQGFVPVVQQVVDDVAEGVQLGAGQGAVGQGQARVAAGPAQPHDLGEQLKPRLAGIGGRGLVQPFDGLLTQGLV